MKSVLVTGCAGFVGYHVTKALIDQDCKVLGIDIAAREDDGSLGSMRLNQLFNYEAKHGTSNFTYACVDMRDYDALRAILAEHNFTHVIHLAGTIPTRASVGLDYFEEFNVKTTENLLKYCRTVMGLQHIVFASTSGVYGYHQIKDAPLKESQILKPYQNFYSISKQECEALLQRFSTYYEKRVTVLRYFSLYGKLMNTSSLLGNYIDSIDHGNTFTMVNDGKMIRDFVYIGDAVRETLDVCFNFTDMPSFAVKNKPTNKYLVINIGTGIGTSVTSFLHVASSILNKFPKMLHIRNLSENMFLVADSDIRKKLWKGPGVYGVGLIQGLTKTLF